MSKTVTKLLPDSLFYFGKIERWLGDMAVAGLRLKLLRSGYAVFEKSGPAAITYNIVELPKRADKRDLSRYKDKGWDFTCNVNTFTRRDYISRGSMLYVFESLKARHSPSKEEVFGDQRQMHKRYRKRRYSHLYYLLASLAALIAAFFDLSENYILFMPGVMLTVSVLFLLLAGINMVETGRARHLAAHSRQLGNLDDGNWVINRRQYRRRFWLKVLSWVLIFGNLLYINYAFVEILTRGNLDDKESFVRLEDIQRAENSASTTYGAFTPSIFVPVFYIAEEEARFYKEDGSSVSARYNITYSKSIIPGVAPIVNANCVLMRLTDRAHSGHVVFTSSERFERVTYLSSFTDGIYSSKICLSNKYEMIFIQYKGDKSVSEVISAVEEVLDRN